MGRRNGDGRAVLVVSADPCLRQGIARLLASRGFRTIEAVDESELIECCRDARPALVLLDLHQSSGDDAATSARLIRRHANLQDTPLLIISDDERREPGASEERGCIAEVFNFDQLIFLLGRLLPKPRRPKRLRADARPRTPHD